MAVSCSICFAAPGPIEELIRAGTDHSGNNDGTAVLLIRLAQRSIGNEHDAIRVVAGRNGSHRGTRRADSAHWHDAGRQLRRQRSGRGRPLEFQDAIPVGALPIGIAVRTTALPTSPT